MSKYAPAVDITVQVIEVLAEEREPIGLSEICRRLDSNKNMVFRILNSLEQSGWVYAENSPERKYRLTLRPFQMTSKVVSRMSLNEVSVGLLNDLWKKLGETVYLAVPYQKSVMYTQHLEGTGDVRVGGVIGGMYDLYCTAPGKVCLAFADTAFQKEYLRKHLKKRTEQTIVTAAALRKELETIRANGFALDDEEFSKGILCAAAPVFDYTGRILGAIGCSVPTAHYDMEKVMRRIQPAVCETAGKISGCLGYGKEEPHVL